jgi:hypothetical protein
METVTVLPMLGKTITAIRVEDEQIIFTDKDGTQFVFYHDQDCCESVTIEDIIGDLTDLLESPLTTSEEVVHEQNDNPEGTPKKEYHEEFTWTFYKFATAKGYVTIRWYGESNGYYSESVNIKTIPADPARRE